MATSGPWAWLFLECGRTFLLELNRKRYNRRASASNPLTSHCVRGESTMNRVLLRCSFAFVLLLAAGISVVAQEGAKHPITFADMIGMHRVAEPQVSPDGKWVAYTVTTPDMETNRGASNIWMVETAGGAELQLTRSGHDSSPAWSPDSKMLAFLSSRSGDSQVYVLSMDGGEAH